MHLFDLKVMKKIIKAIISAVCCLWSRVYTYSMSLWLKNKSDLLYTLWIKNYLGQVGDETLFSYPLRLQGGGSRKIIIGDRCHFDPFVVLGCWKQYHDEIFNPFIVIGDDCNIGECSHVTAINKVTIGDGLLTGRFVYIGDNSHGGLSLEEANILPVKRKLLSKGEINIGRNVWIGDKVTILGGVTIGDNVIIGANSVVTHDIPSNSVAAGMPAKVVKKL